MASYKVLSTSDFVSRLLAERDLVFFTGSGISMWAPSNLPTGYELKKNLFRGITSDPTLDVYYDVVYTHNAILHEHWQKVPLEGIFGAILSEIGDKLFDGLSFLDIDKYNVIHKALVALSNHTTHRTIITTNFDLLFEACDRNGTTPFFSDLNSYPSLNGINLIKLHGSYADKASIVMTLEKEGTGLPVHLQKFLKSFLPGKAICFVGYSASEFDIVPIIKDIPFSRVYWIERSEDAIKGNRRMQYMLEKNDSLVGFDMRVIFQEIANRTTSGAFPSAHWTHNDSSGDIVNFLMKELTTLQKYFVTARIFRSILKIDLAIEVLNKATNLVKQAPHGSAPENLLNLYFELAETYKEKGDYRNAKKYYYRLHAALEKQPNASTIDILKARREIAKLHVLRHEFDIAAVLLKTLINDVCSQLRTAKGEPRGFESLLADCKKNLAMLQLAQIQKGETSPQQITQIEEFLKDLHDNGVKVGNIDKQAEAKRFLARCRRIERKHDEAYELLDEVLEYFHFVGRTMGEINTLREYANNLIMQKRFKEALGLHKTIIQINNDFGKDYPTRLKSFWALCYLSTRTGKLSNASKYFLYGIGLSLYCLITGKCTYGMIRDIMLPKALF